MPEMPPSAIADSPTYGRVYGEQCVRRFIQAAQGQGELPASGENARQVARVVDAAYESSRTRRRVVVETG
jgi:predicted dehydrogenase